jgi:hypothetical protein
MSAFDPLRRGAALKRSSALPVSKLPNGNPEIEGEEDPTADEPCPTSGSSVVADYVRDEGRSAGKENEYDKLPIETCPCLSARH